MALMSSLMSFAATCTSLIFSSVVFFPAAVVCCTCTCSIPEAPHWLLSWRWVRLTYTYHWSQSILFSCQNALAASSSFGCSCMIHKRVAVCFKPTAMRSRLMARSQFWTTVSKRTGSLSAPDVNSTGNNQPWKKACCGIPTLVHPHLPGLTLN